MKNITDAFNKLTEHANAIAEIATSLLVCCRIYTMSQNLAYGILSYFALVVVHAAFTYVFFMKELTTDESKIAEAIEKSQPYLAFLNILLFMMLHYV